MKRLFSLLIGKKFPSPILSDEVQIKADGEFIKM